MASDMDSSWVIWVDHGTGPQRVDEYGLTKEAAQSLADTLRRENPKKRYAVIQIRETPMPQDFR
jgi:hypothetical protein